jgi:type IV secretion system protein VirB6
MKHDINRWVLCGMACLLGLVAFTAIAPQPAHAFSVGNPSSVISDHTCTRFTERENEAFNANTANDGLLTSIYYFIKDIVDVATETLYRSIVQSSSYQYALTGLVTLYVAIFGAMFTIGLIQASFGQMLMRFIKLGILYSALHPSLGWYFFSDYAVSFFNDGTDDLVRGVIQIGTGAPLPYGASPFYQLDKLASFFIHPETIVALLGAASAGPYALGMTGIAVIAGLGFMKMLIEALRVYAVSFVARSILLGIAPIFIMFLLFDKTKQLFNNWLNVLISMSLQPILLFTFMSFMLVMIESSMRNMLNVELCWMETQKAEGTSAQTASWVFIDPNTGKPLIADWTSAGNSSCTETSGSDCAEFPFHIIDVLTFLILVWLTQRFSTVIDRIASELSSTFIALDPAGRLDGFLQAQTSGGGLFSR